MAAIINDIIAQIKDKKLNPKNAIDIVQYTIKAAGGDKEAAIDALECIAKGADGIVNTADDVFDAETVKHIAYLLDTQLAAQLVTVLAPPKWRCCT